MEFCCNSLNRVRVSEGTNYQHKSVKVNWQVNKPIEHFLNVLKVLSVFFKWLLTLWKQEKGWAMC